MESNPARYYRPSGAVPVVGTIMMQLFGAAAAFMLGGLYAAADLYSPSVWLTGFAVFFFGAGVGFAVRVGAKIGKVRNHGFVLLLGLVIGLLAVYVAWVIYIHLFFRRLNVPGIWAWSPGQILVIMKTFAANGIWSMKSWTPTGWALYAFWIAEALCVVLLSVAVAASDETPYCDYCGVWTKKQKDVASFALADPEHLKTELEEERYELLDKLHSQPAHPKNCLKASIHCCPRCEDSDFLTVSHSVVTVDGDGKESTNETALVKQLRVPRDVAEHLVELGQLPNVPLEDSASAPEDEMTI